jgi:hypothetical protein
MTLIVDDDNEIVILHLALVVVVVVAVAVVRGGRNVRGVVVHCPSVCV